MLLKLFNMDHNNINIENMDLSPNNPIITKFFDNLMKDIQVDSMPTISPQIFYDINKKQNNNNVAINSILNKEKENEYQDIIQSLEHNIKRLRHTNMDLISDKLSLKQELNAITKELNTIKEDFNKQEIIIRDLERQQKQKQLKINQLQSKVKKFENKENNVRNT